MYGAVPPIGVAVASPFANPHVGAVVSAAVQVGPAISVNVATQVVVQPLSSVTVTVYIPAAKPLAVAVVWALLHT